MATERSMTVSESVARMLADLLKNDPILFYELVKMARENHKPFGNACERLARRGFIEKGGKVHSRITMAVSCCVHGNDDGNMHVVVQS